MNHLMRADVIASIANDAAKLPAGSAIVVDDFHDAAAAVAGHMTDLVQRWPTGTVQLVLAGRADPPLRLRRLVMAGEARGDVTHAGDRAGSRPAPALRPSLPLRLRPYCEAAASNPAMTTKAPCDIHPRKGVDNPGQPEHNPETVSDRGRDRRRQPRVTAGKARGETWRMRTRFTSPGGPLVCCDA